MRVLVTGATGFVGRAVVRQLANAGHSVAGFARTPRSSRCELATGDILDRAALEDVVKGADAVCHLAALTLVRKSFEQPVRYFEVNVAGTLNLLDAMNAEAERAGRPLRLVYASTWAVYGAPKTQPITEAQQPMPSSPYGASKFAAETVIGYQAALGTVNAVTLRAFNVAGAADGQGDTDSSRIIPRVLLAAAGKVDQVNVNGDGSAVRDFVHVCDLARAYAAALEIPEPTGHRVYNVGSGAGISVRDVIATAQKVTGRSVPVHRGPPAREPRELLADISRIQADLGWRPTLSNLEMMISDAWQALTDAAR